jgi:hypothetical protein
VQLEPFSWSALANRGISLVELRRAQFPEGRLAGSGNPLWHLLALRTTDGPATPPRTGEEACVAS